LTKIQKQKMSQGISPELAKSYPYLNISSSCAGDRALCELKQALPIHDPQCEAGIRIANSRMVNGLRQVIGISPDKSTACANCSVRFQQLIPTKS